MIELIVCVIVGACVAIVWCLIKFIFQTIAAICGSKNPNNPWNKNVW